MEIGGMTTLSPRDLASAVGVSQSSIKRWVDAGLIAVSRTAGGHRRISVPEALRFVRERGMSIQRPELLGISELGSQAAASGSVPDWQLLNELIARHRLDDARSAILGWYVGGASIADIFDGPITHALADVGSNWEEKEDGIYREHMATSAIVSALVQLEAALPAVPVYAPVAVGGSIEDDAYVIPSMMASCIFKECGFRVVNLGANTPAATFAVAVERTNASAVWIATKSPVLSMRRVNDYAQLVRKLLKKNVNVYLGGRAIHRFKPLPKGAQVAGSMQELAEKVRADNESSQLTTTSTW